MSFIVAPASSIEIGAAALVSGVLDTLMLTSSVVAGAAATSRHGRERWVGVLKLVDLDLSCYDMRSDLLDLWSLEEFLELVESNDKIGAWSLVDRLVAHHVELLPQITPPTWWAVSIHVAHAGRLSILVTLGIGVRC